MNRKIIVFSIIFLCIISPIVSAGLIDNILNIFGITNEEETIIGINKYSFTNIPNYNIELEEIMGIVKFDAIEKSILEYDSSMSNKIDNSTWRVCTKLKDGINPELYNKYPIYLTDIKDNKTGKKIDIDIASGKFCFDMDVSKYWRIQFGENSLELELMNKSFINLSFWNNTAHMYIELRKAENSEWGNSTIELEGENGTLYNKTYETWIHSDYQPVDDIYMFYNDETDSWNFGKNETVGELGHYQFYVKSDYSFISTNKEGYNEEQDYNYTYPELYIHTPLDTENWFEYKQVIDFAEDIYSMNYSYANFKWIDKENQTEFIVNFDAYDVVSKSLTPQTGCGTISSAGFYKLTGDIINSINGTCIKFSAQGIDLDLNGYRVDGIDAINSFGIVISGSADYGKVYNGEVSDWNWGISISNAYSATTRSVTIKNITSYSNTIGMSSAGNYVWFENVTSYSNALYGLVLSINNKYTTIINSEYYDNKYGIYLQNSDGSTLGVSVINSNVVNNTNSDLFFAYFNPGGYENRTFFIDSTTGNVSNSTANDRYWETNHRFLLNAADACGDLVSGANVTVYDKNGLVNSTAYPFKTIDGEYYSGTESDNWTYIVVPDVQLMTQNNVVQLNNTLQWIVNNEDALNIQHVMFVGDLINVFQNLTQWDNFNNSISQTLDTGGISYTLAVGNHDVGTYTGVRNYTDFDTYFPTSRYSGESWYGGSSYTYALNWANKTINGEDYMFISVPVCPNATDISWANSEISTANPDHIILSTHVLLDDAFNSYSRGTQCGDMTTFVDTLLNQSDITFAWSGDQHDTGFDGESLLQMRNDNNKLMTMIMSNYQTYASNGEGGLKIVNINPGTDIVEVQTYFVSLDKYDNDMASHLILENQDGKTLLSPLASIAVDGGENGSEFRIVSKLNNSEDSEIYEPFNFSIESPEYTQKWTGAVSPNSDNRVLTSILLDEFNLTGMRNVDCSCDWNLTNDQVIPSGDVTLFSSTPSVFNIDKLWDFTGTNQYLNVNSSCEINILSGGEID